MGTPIVVFLTELDPSSQEQSNKKTRAQGDGFTFFLLLLFFAYYYSNMMLLSLSCDCRHAWSSEIRWMVRWDKTRNGPKRTVAVDDIPVSRAQICGDICYDFRGRSDSGCVSRAMGRGAKLGEEHGNGNGRVRACAASARK